MSKSDRIAAVGLGLILAGTAMIYFPLALILAGAVVVRAAMVAGVKEQ